jgi:hypothetical protein
VFCVQERTSFIVLACLTYDNYQASSLLLLRHLELAAGFFISPESTACTAPKHCFFPAEHIVSFSSPLQLA